MIIALLNGGVRQQCAANVIRRLRDCDVHHGVTGSRMANHHEICCFLISRLNLYKPVPYIYSRNVTIVLVKETIIFAHGVRAVSWKIANDHVQNGENEL